MKPEEMLYLENQLCFPLYAASRLTTQLYGPLLKKLDITYPQYLVLLVLWQRGALSVGEISRLLLLESNTLTPLLKRMEEKGLVTRQRSKQDERSVLIGLTAKGERLKEEALCIPMQIINSLQGDTISMEEALAFKATLHKLLGVLGDAVGEER